MVIITLLAGTAFAADPNQSPSPGAEPSATEPSAEPQHSGGMQHSTSPENTRRNKNHQTTAEDQSESKHDRELTRKIRSAVVGNHKLSSTAKNVKIITTNGSVTLRGPVKSEDEKNAIGAAAEKYAGQKVNNELEVSH